MGSRNRHDRCPGVLRPWPAADGALVRLRVPGGQLPAATLSALLSVAEEYGDARIHVTGRANLQLRALPADDAHLPPAVVAALEGTGLVPSRRHDLVRNVLVSPQTGLAGGRADLRPVAAELDRLLLTDDRLGDLPGRFLFTLDDGRGDLADRHRDLGLVALADDLAQLRVGQRWGPVVPLAGAAPLLLRLAHDFLDLRGEGPDAAWHVTELPEPLTEAQQAEPGADERAPALPYGVVPGGVHHHVPDGIDRALLDGWVADHLVLTPWHGVLVPSAVVEVRGAPATSLETTPERPL
jgi:precorrin-3B synthase